MMYVRGKNPEMKNKKWIVFFLPALVVASGHEVEQTKHFFNVYNYSFAYTHTNFWVPEGVQQKFWFH